MVALSTKAQEFLSKKPTVIGVVLGVKYYEHPTKGDEVPLVIITDEGKVKYSDFYELPTLNDLT